LNSYDNVGGELLDAALQNMKIGGRIGKIASACLCHNSVPLPINISHSG
jgi:NADPH-dependent curcumin reductase CurA